MGQPASEYERLFAGEQAKALRVRRMGLLFKRGEPLAERIDAGVLLLERVELALLRSELLVLGLQPLSEFPCLLGLLLQFVLAAGR
jgi:hypothetical protein